MITYLNEAFVLFQIMNLLFFFKKHIYNSDNLYIILQEKHKRITTYKYIHIQHNIETQ